jgi:2-polyprenyl-6-methoxyphenol hydroxylase-like FAD-dependent oxidoreductase
MHDAIVIGARCAGAATAMLLARAGFDVLLVDRARFPSEIPHGHFIHRHGPGRLSRWGLLDRVLATGCPAVSSLTLDFGDFPLAGRDLVVDGVPVGLGPRRAALDKVLVDAAVEAGVELRERFVVDDLSFEDERVTGIRGRAVDGGAPVSETARFVVGADGRNSGVAKRVEAPAYEAVPTLTCWYFSYWSEVPGDGLEIYLRDRRVIFAFPTNDGLFAVFVAWPIEELATVRADAERELLAVVDRVPELAERVRGGRREELALGVCDAFRDAELLATVLGDVLSGHRPEAEALADYERLRNEATLPDYHLNLWQAQFKPLPPELLELRASARESQEATNQLLLAGEGRIAQ